MAELQPLQNLYADRRQDVFVINDIDLVVPPTNISVQKEDLVYSWKTLRTNTSTKIPSGQGQIAVSVIIPFTATQVLDLHRLVVEFKHSPFCYVENRFLRETIVPHWNIHQAMAFTMTGLSVSPMQGSSDTWVAQLDMTWFNYAPYVHNWLYRKDWHTVPLTGNTGLEDPTRTIEVTIGWDWVENQKRQRRVLLPPLNEGPGASTAVKTWDVVQEQYVDQDVLSIEDMEVLHRGEVFDLLPMPGRMSPAQFVARPRDSRIYTRYINFLQRDALLRNFDIDVEKDLGWANNQSTRLHSSFFAAVLDGNDRHTYGIHDGLPGDGELARKFRKIKGRWIGQMNSHHGDALFSFAAYQEIRLPEEWNEAIGEAHSLAAETAMERFRTSTNTLETFVPQYNDKEVMTSRRRVRRGWSNPIGKVCPVGRFGTDVPLNVEEAAKAVSGELVWRDRATATRLAGVPTPGYMHVGTDFASGQYGVYEGSPVFAVADGVVSGIRTVDNSLDGFWILAMLDDKDKLLQTAIRAGDEDWQNSIRAVVPTAEFEGPNLQDINQARAFPVGTFVKSVGIQNAWYYVKPRSGGNSITISHANSAGGTDISVYVHLQKPAEGLTVNDKVTAGQIIGYVGRTGRLKQSTLKSRFKNAQQQWVWDRNRNIDKGTGYNYVDGSEAQEESPWQYGVHLHFEYWESFELGAGKDPPYDFDDGIEETPRRRYGGAVPVDPIPSFEIAAPGQKSIQIDPARLRPTEENVTDQLNAILEPEEVESISEILGTLWADDWLYYDKERDISNVWWKTFHLGVHPNNPEQDGSIRFASDDIVLTGVAGALRHVVSNIPILSHEYPTQQHLGSVEPMYSFEFAVLDNQGQDGQELAGISKNAELLMAMRTMLHANARQFRPVADSWGVSCKSFVTRLLGSFETDDIRYAFKDANTDTDEERLLDDIELVRRLVNTRGSSMNVEGHPGLSMHTLEFCGTNPYDKEAITSTAPQLTEIEEARKLLLTRLWNLEFAEKYNDLIHTLLIAQLAGANTNIAAGEDDFGRFELQQIGAPQPGSGVALYQAGDQDYVTLGYDTRNNPAIQRFLETNPSKYYQPVPGQDGVYGYLLKGLLDDEYELETEKRAAIETPLTSTPVPADALALSGNAYATSYGSAYTTPTNPTYQGTYRKFDISALINESQESQLIAEIPLEKILDYWMLVHETVATAEMMLAEDSDQVTGGAIRSGGTGVALARQELYDLPIVPGLFKHYQEWLRRYAEFNARWAADYGVLNFPVEMNREFNPLFSIYAGATTPPGTAVNHLENNLNWVKWTTEYKLKPYQLDRLDQSFNAQSLNFAEIAFGSSGRPVEFVIESVTDAPSWLLSWVDPEWMDKEEGATDPTRVRGIYADFFESQHQAIHLDIARNYILQLPIRNLLEERFKSYVNESIFGDILGDINGEGGSPVFRSTTTQLKNTVLSCGYWTWSKKVDLPVFVINEAAFGRASNDADIQQGFFDEQILTPEGGGVKVPVASYDKGTYQFVMFNGVRDIYDYGSPFIWFVDEGVEDGKLKYFKELFAFYADDMMRDADVLRAFGLESLQTLNRRALIKGGPAYPDMDLPFHPYYGDLTSTSPDFYMWNMYEDGDAHNEQVVELFTESMNSIVQRCYDSMKKLETGGQYSPTRDKLVLEPGFDQPITINQIYAAEASDGGGKFSKGQTAFPYAPTPDQENDVRTYLNQMTERAKDVENRSDEVRQNGNKDDEGTGRPIATTVMSKSEIDALDSRKVDNISLSNFEGPYGQGGGVNYPRRASDGHYQALKDQVASVERMFGSRAGHLGLEELPADAQQRQEGTFLARQANPSHEFTAESIKLLAQQSSRDLLSQKRTVRRAYPTFKLFFVEEDEFESRLLNFDDFYSYNGVTSFTVVQSRKSPADHAVITVLNVGGTLDGTKRDAVVDLDYFSDTKNLKVPEGASTTGSQPIQAGTALDQPFGALVLRPGLNVQLRMGYSNDPDMLEVMLNGRVVDVQWNSSGDRAELLVQSFGTELVQAIKGTNFGDETEGYATTHHLLGAMMLSPELTHFGRWELGQLYQVGEGSDARLDFNDYSREGFLGRFGYSNSLTKWFLDHPILTLGLAVGGGALLSRIPGVGGILRGATRVGGKVPWVASLLSRAGVVGSARSVGLLTRQFTRQLQRRGVANATRTTAQVTGQDIAAVVARNGGQWNVLSRTLRRIGGEAAGEAFERKAKAALARSVGELAKKGVTTPEQAAKLIAKAEADAISLVLKGQWFGNLAIATDISAAQLFSAGGRATGRLIMGTVTKVPVLLGAAAVVGLGADVLAGFLEPLYNATVRRIQAYFRSKQSTIFLSPQDDNLYPPHPKDYMEIYDRTWWKAIRDLSAWTIKSTVTAVAESDELGTTVARWFVSTDPFDKRVEPEACLYKPQGVTIWDVFHEMSLRHPGWVYGARPYGKEFRYTMFFGVPSQRYWARGADPLFISRANDLVRILGGPTNEPEVTWDEYRRLYGDEFEFSALGSRLSVEDARDKIEYDSIVAAETAGHTVHGDNGTWFVREEEQVDETSDAWAPTWPEPVLRQSFLKTPAEQLDELQTLPGDVELEQSDIYKGIAHNTLTARVLKEYLSALNLRFLPFRRYHSFSSEHDIVWNGLISSENAVYNAVDITYHNSPGDSTSQMESALFKSHAFIPEYMLRVMPMQPSHNIRGYQMAMRYGVGQLLHSMREMYRGEIVVLGNPRIRPWDIGIVSDSYNDMVGPVEVEQVVHIMSHETGYITEIKPSAVVFANEISSWPVLEALKTLTLAVKDVDDSFVGLRAADGGGALRALDWIMGFGAGGSQEYIDHLNERAKKLQPFDPFENADGTSNLEDINELGSQIESYGKGLVVGGAVLGGVLGAGLAYKGAPWIMGKIPAVANLGENSRYAIKVASAIGIGGAWAGQIGFAGAAAVNTASSITPSLAWLLGGPVLFLSCLRGDSIMLLPLMKNGHPIVSGLNMSDPSMMWNNFKGSLGRWVDDHISGTRDLTQLWRVQGQHAWRRIRDDGVNLFDGNPIVDNNGLVRAELTGEER